MMPEITETEFKKQIERGTFGSLYLLHGEEKYLLKLYANRLIEKAAGVRFRILTCNGWTAEACPSTKWRLRWRRCRCCLSENVWRCPTST